jgi:hypothetical protein
VGNGGSLALVDNERGLYGSGDSGRDCDPFIGITAPSVLAFVIGVVVFCCCFYFVFFKKKKKI